MYPNHQDESYVYHSELLVEQELLTLPELPSSPGF